MNATEQQRAHITALNAQPASPHETLPALNLSVCPARLTVISSLDFKRMHQYMRMLSAIELPQSGLITLLGQDCRQFNADQFNSLRKQIAYVLEDAQLLSVLNGKQNLMLAARYHQIGTESFIQQKAHELLSHIPYADQHQLLPDSMSPLVRRLIAIARPLMLDPKVIFIENPFYGLGIKHRFQLQRYLGYIVSNLNIALVISCDNIDYMQQSADQIVFCDDNQTHVFDDWSAFKISKHANIKQLFDLHNPPALNSIPD